MELPSLPERYRGAPIWWMQDPRAGKEVAMSFATKSTDDGGKILQVSIFKPLLIRMEGSPLEWDIGDWISIGAVAQDDPAKSGKASVLLALTPPEARGQVGSWPLKLLSNDGGVKLEVPIHPRYDAFWDHGDVLLRDVEIRVTGIVVANGFYTI